MRQVNFSAVLSSPPYLCFDDCILDICYSAPLPHLLSIFTYIQARSHLRDRDSPFLFDFFHFYRVSCLLDVLHHCCCTCVSLFSSYSMSCICSAKSTNAYAKAGRTPPDPTLFPNYMQNEQQLWLRFSEWWPHGDGDNSNAAAGTPPLLRGVVFIVSGLGEHSGRYDSVALRLTKAGYACFSVDNQGAGGSEGVRLYVERFVHFVDDICSFVKFIQAKYPCLATLPHFLIGHSMGGLIATRVALRHPLWFKGIVLSGPAYATVLDIGSWTRSLLRKLSNWVPKLPVMQLDATLVSHNTPVAELVQNDPYYSNVKLRARFLAEMLAAQDVVSEEVSSGATFPFLIVHGEDDRLCSLQKAKLFYEAAPSTDKKMKTYPNAGHEVLTELCRGEVMEEVMNFITSHTK